MLAALSTFAEFRASTFSSFGSYGGKTLGS